MSFNLRSAVVSAVCLLASAGASAAVLVQQLPTDLTASQESDFSSTPIWVQAFPALSGATLNRIDWWGFRGANSAANAVEDFEVFLGASQLSGTLSTSAYAIDATHSITLYSLDVGAIALAATELSIWNINPDVEWFWYGATGTDTAGAQATAFSLDGTRGGSVPEPSTLALLGLAGLGLWASRRRMG